MNSIDMDLESFYEVKLGPYRYRQLSSGSWLSEITGMELCTEDLRILAERMGYRIKPVIKYRWNR